MHDELHVGMVMTWEVYGDNDASFEDCFKMFNPQTKEDLDAVVQRWTAAMFALFAALPGHPAMPQTNAVDAPPELEIEDDAPAVMGGSDKGSQGVLGRKGGTGGGESSGSGTILKRDDDYESSEVGSIHKRDDDYDLDARSDDGGEAAAQQEGLSKKGAGLVRPRLPASSRALGVGMLVLACLVLAAFVMQMKGRSSWWRLRFGRRRHQISIF